MRMKPLPWKCGYCREKAVQLVKLPYSTNISHDGRSYTVTIPDLEVGCCERCGKMVIPYAAEQRITETFRQQLGLLMPDQIRHGRESLDLTQKQFAKLIGSADATQSRWETGIQIQSRAMDRLLRLFFAFGNVRAALADEANLARLGLEEAAAAQGPFPPPDRQLDKTQDPPKGPGRNRLNANKRDELMECLGKKDELSVGLLPQPSVLVFAQPSKH